MRIAQMLLSRRVGGAESLVDSLNSAFERRGCEAVTVFLDDDAENTSPVNRVRRVRRIMGELQPDVLLAHSALPIVYSAIGCAQGLPLIAVLHSGGDDYASRKLRWAQRALLSRFDSTVAVSQEQANRYARTFRLNVDEIEVIPNGVNVSEFRPPSEPTAEGVLRLLTATRLIESKRIDVAIEAVGLLGGAGVEVELDILGDGERPLVERLHSLASSAASEHCTIRFRGSRPDVAELMRESDGLVHCSETEAFSVALVEAACSGLPLFLAEGLQSAPRSAVVYRHRDGDAASLAESLRRFAVHKAERRAEAYEAAALVANQYSIDSCAERYLGVIERSAAS